MDLKKYIIYKNYIKELIKNQNNTNVLWLENLFSLEDYERIFKPVLELIDSNPNATLTTLRLNLFLRSGIKELTDNFINQTKITPGLILDFGTLKNRDTILCGNRQEYVMKNGILLKNDLPIEQDTIFDLASTSKLFTSIAILKLYEDGLIDLYAPITQYDKRFINLRNVTVYDLLKFRIKIKTDKRIDSVKNPKDAERIIFSAYPVEMKILENAYTDIGAMVLKYVIEAASKMSYTDFVNEAIIKYTNMKDTYLNVPKDKLYRVANENYSTIITHDGKEITNYKNNPGIPHDTKAISVGHKYGIAPGHAGYFSTKSDLIKLAKSLIEGNILSKEMVYSMSDTATGFLYDEGYSRCYGSLVYLKQKNSDYLSVNPALSGKAFMSPGFAGTSLVIDPLNKISIFIGSPRLHNRIYQIAKEQEEKIIVDSHNKKTFRLANGTEKIISSDYTKAKEVMISLATTLTLQYQLLEKLIPNNKEMHLVRELN